MRAATLAFCVVGIYGCFLLWGYFQEKLTTTDYGPVDPETKKGPRFHFFIFMNLIQSLIACGCAAVYAAVRHVDLSVGHMSWNLRGLYMLVGLTSCVASPIGYSSLKFINFPTMTLSKSCKLVPVMAVQVLLYRKRYPLYKYASVALITLGIFMFFLNQPEKEGKAVSNSLWGVFLVVLNLLLDGFTNSTEDVIFKEHRTSATQLMFFLNLAQAFLMILWLLNPWNSELFDVLSFFSSYPESLYDLVVFSLAGALGQTIIFFTLEQFGSLTLVTITVTRKLFSIVLSVISFGHSLSSVQQVCVLVVFLGIFLESFLKDKNHHTHSHSHSHSRSHSHGHEHSPPSSPLGPLKPHASEKFYDKTE